MRYVGQVPVSLLIGFAVIGSCSISSIAAAQSESRQPVIAVGQRQDWEKTAPNTIPMARVSQRLQTRIDSRISNRLTRGVGSTASFTSANSQVQKTKPKK